MVARKKRRLVGDNDSLSIEPPSHSIPHGKSSRLTQRRTEEHKEIDMLSIQNLSPKWWSQEMSSLSVFP
jgi:hypothetical protein